MICKLCHKDIDVTQTTKADVNMCKKCYTDLAQYRRWRASKTKLQSHQESKVGRLDSMIEYNRKHDLFVPKFYLADTKQIVCATCVDTFETSTGITICEKCRSRESNYYLANRTGNSMSKMDAYYSDAFSEGRKVPKLFLDRYYL